MMVSFLLTRVSILLKGSVSSLSDGVNVSFILTGLLGSLFLMFSVIFTFCLTLPSFPESLAAQVPGGFDLSPGETLAGLAEVWVGLEGL